MSEQRTKNNATLSELCGEVSHAEARKLLQAFVKGHHDKKWDGRNPTIRIPADPKNDTDLRFLAYIKQNESRISIDAAINAVRGACATCEGKGEVWSGRYVPDSSQKIMQVCPYCARPIAAIRSLRDEQPKQEGET